ncbi:MAG: LPS export ABC transporter permease LptG [Pseudomonadota bacterium]
MTLSFYFARRFFFAVIYVFTAVLFLAIIFDVLELARRAGDDVDVGFGTLVGLAMLRAPSISIKAAPYAMLLAAMWTYARLARSSELVVARAAGLSGFGLALPGVATAAFFGAFATMVYNPISATLLDNFERASAKVFRDDDRLVAVEKTGLWLRQGNASAQTVIHALRSNADGTDLGQVTIYQYGPGDTNIGRIDAATARLSPGYWRLEDAVIRRFDPDDPDAPLDRRSRAFHDLETDLTPDQIIESFASPETIPFWRLPEFIATLEDQGFSSRRHVLHFHVSLAAPLIFAAMALLGAAFSMRHARFGGLGVMALYGTLSGFVVFFLFDIAQALAASGHILAVPAAWGPPAAAMMFAAGLLLHFEEG